MNDAERRLFSCFASRNWCREVASGWPYADLPALLDAADRAWADLAPSDWAEALQGHPRIGESGGSSPDASEREQRGVREVSDDVQSRLAEANRRYEARFGHVFLIAAAGKSADEILATLLARMDNDPVTEARVAAAEHRKIARMRLARMVSD
ncbi:MAG TPA: 2-oxo-4-hydroxy-4-carboxy-5-ureidoimidazoline decarboxylase [Candidatus Dormibacteraeota bacterium]|nr:2-oxo-4-hydroxy-4-carboxy-5-ureidoimidazoline decarboxylase [Candidatus Dormibacteraeota bacterium]